MVEELLMYKPDVNKLDLYGDSPLVDALKNDNYEIVKLLLINKAKPFINSNPNFKDIHVNSDMQRLLDRAKLYWIRTYLMGLKNGGDDWKYQVKLWIF